MRKLLLTISFILLLASNVFAFTFSDVSNKKCTSEYSNSTSIDNMDTISFGSYMQSSSTKEPIEWLILEKRDDKVMLLSKYLLDYLPYNESNSDTLTWENSSIRTWLNNSFYNDAFNVDERSKIINTNIINANSINLPRNATTIGNNTNDNVFLLSIDECKKYFNLTLNDITNPDICNSLIGIYTNYSANKAMGGNFNRNDSSYWLRSFGTVDSDTDNNSFNMSRNNVSELFCVNEDGVRPVIWVRLDAIVKETTTKIEQETIETTAKIEQETTSQETVIETTTIEPEATTIKTINETNTRKIEETVLANEANETTERVKNIDWPTGTQFDALIPKNSIDEIQTSEYKDGFLGLFGNDVYEITLWFNNINLPQDLIRNYDYGHKNDGGNIIDMFGNRIKRFYYGTWWVDRVSYEIHAFTSEDRDNIIDDINSLKPEEDYILFFCDNVIKSTGTYEFNKDEARFVIDVDRDNVKYADAHKFKDIKVDEADGGLEILPSIGGLPGLSMGLTIGGDVYYARVMTKHLFLNEAEIDNFVNSCHNLETKIYDNLGHKILGILNTSNDCSFYTSSLQEAEEIASYINSSNSEYKVYCFDNVITSTGTAKADESSALFKITYNNGNANYAYPFMDVERKIGISDTLDGLSIEKGEEYPAVRISNKLTYEEKKPMREYGSSHENDNSFKLIDNLGHRLRILTDNNFFERYGTETIEEAREIASYINSKDCEYIVYYYD